MLHGHGNDGYNYSSHIVADFSSNVWFEGPPPELLKHLQENISAVDHYPEPEGGTLQEKVAGFHHLAPENCLITNGSVESFYLIALAYRYDQSDIIIPCFSEYEDACRIHGHNLQFVNNTGGWEKKIIGKQLVWFGNPNNPDGKVYRSEALEKMLRQNPNSIFVIDEAYGELCSGFQSAVPLISRHRNLIIVRSFTKSFAIPGLRLGYVMGDDSLIQKLRQLKMPWTVNALALEAGKYIIDHYTQLIPDKQKVESVSRDFQGRLNSLKDLLTVIPSDCNYFLVRLNHDCSEKLKKFLIEKYGVLIRDASNFRGLDEHYIRLAVQKPRHNDLLIEGLKDGMNHLTDE